jgi:enamine deaminase RidA (YjgF/YER057c/UK114 family)
LFHVWNFNPDHLVENDSKILEYDYEQLSIAGHLRAARQTEMSTTAPAQPGLTRGRYPLVRVRHHRSSMLELVTAGSASAQEIHLTVRPRDGEAVTAVARRAAAELTLRQALAVRILGFGSLAARNATLAVLRLQLNDDVPMTWVEGASCDGHSLAGLQIQAVTGMEVHLVKADHSVAHAPCSSVARQAGTSAMARVWKNGHATHCVLSGLVPAHTNISPARQTMQLFRVIQTGLAEAGMEMKDIARTWFYLDDILSWYGAFNRVRNDFFHQHKISAAAMPASTGVCGRNPVGAALTAAIWAVRPDDPAMELVRTVASPGQCPAPAYGSAFSRAVEITSNGFRQLLISGTASIAPGGKTSHVGNVEAQIDRTMEVVEGILAARHMSLADTSRATAYFKSANEVAVFSRWLKQRGVKHLPLVNVCCDICRPDLLFELELDALRNIS